MSYFCCVCGSEFPTQLHVNAHMRWCKLNLAQQKTSIFISASNIEATWSTLHDDCASLGDAFAFDTDAPLEVSAVDRTYLNGQNVILENLDEVSYQIRRNAALLKLLDIYSFGIGVALSNKEGNYLLKVLKSFSSEPFLFKTYETLKLNASKYAKTSMAVKTFSLSMPPDFSNFPKVIYKGHYLTCSKLWLTCC